MSGLFALLFLASIVAFLISMVKPSLFSKISITRRKNAALLFGGLTFLFLILGGATAPQPSTTAVKGASVAESPTVIPTVKPTKIPTPTIVPTKIVKPTLYIQPTTQQQTNVVTPQTQGSSGLSNNNYYTNSSGNQVHSPAYSNNGQAPAGATAQCADGTYSFSQHHQGTCSGHGGVASWL